MKNSKFVFDKITKLLEQGLISSRDLTTEIITILKSKRDEIVFKMKLVSKDELEVLSKRVENLENKIEKFQKKKKKKSYTGKKILTSRPFNLDFSNLIFPPCDRIMSDAIESPRPTLDFVSALPLSIL